MDLTQNTREVQIRELINFWLRDTRKKCGWCGAWYNPLFYPCCEQPFIADNFEIMTQFYEELKTARASRKNTFASTGKDNKMRWKLSFPPSLLTFLTHAWREMYQEELFTDKYNTTWFAKHFRKAFAVPERI
jgi:hypothetical protein